MIGLFGIFSLLSNSLSLNRVVSDRYIASFLAEEGIEVVKNIIDKNVIEGRAFNANLGSGSYSVDYKSDSLLSLRSDSLLFNKETGIYSYDRGEPTKMIREIKLDLVANYSLRVNSIVRYTTRGGGSFEVNLEDIFYDWR